MSRHPMVTRSQTKKSVWASDSSTNYKACHHAGDLTSYHDEDRAVIKLGGITHNYLYNKGDISVPFYLLPEYHDPLQNPVDGLGIITLVEKSTFFLMLNPGEFAFINKEFARTPDAANKENWSRIARKISVQDWNNAQTTSKVRKYIIKDQTDNLIVTTT
ncbi:Hypothetical predicted protein [Paramuricea clavata]|uniref:Uncharacterized protein n=1 Tax=Paramuricea clavata TaxID=317549 RepID=A0A7D9DDH1_PARCT|nr:Hypothetical predicted protein [Paramuricea clavata]